jgi:dihydrofolate synthase/folylpolyglutamate synthase
VEIFLEQRELGTLGEEMVREVLAKVRIPGRIEVIGHKPFLVVDGAHNPISMRVLLDTVRESFRFQDLHVVFACSRDKDIRSLLLTLVPEAARWTFTTFDFPRIEDPARIEAMLLEISPNADTRITWEPSSALEDARKRSRLEDLILCCGSFYLAGEILQRVPATI